MARGWRMAAGERPAPGTTHLIGVDEAGRGPVIGPLVVAALAVPVDGGDEALREMGVRDSKKLRPARREMLYSQLVGRPHVVVEVPATDLDARSVSLNVLEAKVFAAAVLGLLRALGPGAAATVYLDAADASELSFERRFRAAMAGDPLAASVLHVVSRHKADDTFPVVSAASIVAKSRREAAIAGIKRELGHDFGSGYCHDRGTIEFLEKWITEKGNLPPHTRRSWKPAGRIEGGRPRRGGSLDDFEGGEGRQDEG